LIKGGRIGKVTGFVGQVLSLKPVITCDFEGIYSTVAKVRSHMQGINTILNLIEEEFKNYKEINVAVANCNRATESDYINQEINKRLSNINKLFNGSISPALTVHTGPDLIGVTAYCR
jgi:DegV family protein with EDD domain